MRKRTLLPRKVGLAFVSAKKRYRTSPSCANKNESHPKLFKAFMCCFCSTKHIFAFHRVFATNTCESPIYVAFLQRTFCMLASFANFACKLAHHPDLKNCFHMTDTAPFFTGRWWAKLSRRVLTFFALISKCPRRRSLIICAFWHLVGKSSSWRDLNRCQQQ